MLDYIPLALWYSLPIIVIMILAWIFQETVYRKIDRSMGIRTKVCSEDLTQKLLNEHNVKIPVEAGDNYLRNEYNPEKKKIFFSPFTMHESDYTSICYAIRAAAQAIFEKKSPLEAQFTRSVGYLQATAFWIVFTIISFGLMSSSLSMTLIGYASALIPYACHRFVIYSELKRSMKLFQETKYRTLFSAGELAELEKVLKAIIIRY